MIDWSISTPRRDGRFAGYHPEWRGIMAHIMKRRMFLTAPLGASLAAQTSTQGQQAQQVYAFGDGIPHTPAEYSALLSELSKPGKLEPDRYSQGGAVQELEARMAALLGKETAIWLPTGTLANHLAVRLLAGSKRRVLVQAESHLFNDSGDCAQTLSGLHLVPLAAGHATFSLKEVERAAYEARLGRVATPIGAIQIETPVRRRAGERFDFTEMSRIAAWAREHRIGIHLDGARLFLDAIYAGRPIKEYTALFDTVYVSLYKCFNAASGAVLAGSRELLADLHHTRRMFGGGLHQVWPLAAVALNYIDGFEQSFGTARQTAEEAIAALSSDPGFGIERIPNGTNVFRLRVFDVNPPVYRLRLEEAGISASAPDQDWFTMQVNPTWSRATAKDLVSRFRKGLG
jgi:threonine aldolase